jgi:hypothetical protein
LGRGDGRSNQASLRATARSTGRRAPPPSLWGYPQVALSTIVPAR